MGLMVSLQINRLTNEQDISLKFFFRPTDSGLLTLFLKCDRTTWKRNNMLWGIVKYYQKNVVSGLWDIIS